MTPSFSYFKKKKKPDAYHRITYKDNSSYFCFIFVLLKLVTRQAKSAQNFWKSLDCLIENSLKCGMMHGVLLNIISTTFFKIAFSKLSVEDT